MDSSIAARVDRIVETFKAAREVAEREGRSAVLADHLASRDAYYSSVAFEGAAMGLALRDVSEWDAFLNNEAAKHAVQVHIGLGWALAEMQHPMRLHADWNDPDSVLDGYGYYHGLFRRRLTIRTQGIPSTLETDQLPGFDRGVGRSLWYISKGDLDQVLLMVSAFAPGRQPQLWLGVGIAAAFVGGCSEVQAKALSEAAGMHRASLRQGAERAYQSRVLAQTPLDEVLRLLEWWKAAA